MELTQIEEQECPCCQAAAVSEYVETDVFSDQVRTHANGNRWETRVYACGSKAKYIPNMDRVEYTQCKNDPEIIQQVSRQEESLKKLEKYIDRMKVSDGLKEDLRDRFKYVSAERGII